MTQAEVLVLLHDACRSRGGQARLARRAGISSTFIWKVKSGFSPPGRRLLGALGVERAGLVYRRIDDGRPI